MTHIKVFFTILFTVCVSIAQSITISGIVTDTGTTPLPGAVVKLEKNGMTTISGADGRFTFTNVGIIGNEGVFKGINISASISNGFIHLHIRERRVVEIITHTLKGETVFRLKRTLDVGSYTFALPNQCNGVYLYRIKHGANTLLLKSTSIYGAKGVSSYALNTIFSNTATASNPMNRYVPLEDVIAVVKDGYLNYRVIVTNSDTSGIEIKMIVCADTVRDIDGNLYQAVRIGNQIWTVENFRVTRYNDGTTIPLVPDNTEWSKLTTPGYCFYNNATNLDTIKKWGALYNWYVISPIYPKIAPSGWRVPDTTDWNTLENYLITNGYNFDSTIIGNKIARAMASKADWLAATKNGTIGNNLVQNNRSGFTALPSGSRSDNGYYNYRNISGFWWASIQSNPTFAWYRDLTYSLDNFSRYTYYKSCGYSIRLVRDARKMD